MNVDYPFGIFKLFLQKRSLNKDGQQFQPYQQNEQPPQTIEQSKKDKIWSLKCDLFDIEEYNKEEKIHATG
jgi:type III secretory pathway component EscR